jgi:deoxyribodipyrimidine photo-lyase
MPVNRNRIRILREGESKQGPVAYWMSRDQRVHDNWALLYAQEAALERKAPLIVVFSLAADGFVGATIRHYRFMLQGLHEVKNELAALNIPFYLLLGVPEQQIADFVKRNGIALVVADFDPLRIKRAWKRAVVDGIHIPFHEVDAHNIVPCWKASEKQEYGAFTIRPKIRRLLAEYEEGFPDIERHPFNWEKEAENFDPIVVEGSLRVNERVGHISWILPGEAKARAALRDFLDKGLPFYTEKRNDPGKSGQSGLSPYLHFGQLAAGRAALEAERCNLGDDAKASFLEELVIRRELSDNYCFYNDEYDCFEGFPEWAKKSLDEHRADHREYIYSLQEFEEGETHDDLWNAAQMEMVKLGKMHGYMRMYWAKKILEWTPSPEEAVEIATYLNDKYELDGRDPNGYTGVAWAIGGVHDRPWRRRNVFGMVRYMSYRGCVSKFDVNAYIAYARSV